MRTVLAFLSGIILMAALGALQAPGELRATKLTITDQAGRPRIELNGGIGGECNIRLLSPMGGNAVVISTSPFFADDGVTVTSYCANVYIEGAGKSYVAMYSGGRTDAGFSVWRDGSGCAQMRVDEEAGAPGEVKLFDSARNRVWSSPNAP